MKKLFLLFTILCTVCLSWGQYSTGTYGIGFTNTSVRFDTTPTTVTLTLKGDSTKWMGVGFGSFSGFTMANAVDMFIWSDAPERDYTPDTSSNSGHNIPFPDADQSWTIVSDTVTAGIRTVVATRPLVSAGDYTITNSSSTISIIYAQGDTTSLAYHGTTGHKAATIGRTYFLALEDFSAEASSLYPNPSHGSFVIKTKTSFDTLTLYSQTGALVKSMALEAQKEDQEINVNGIATGVYIVELKNGMQKTYKNIVVE